MRFIKTINIRLATAFQKIGFPLFSALRFLIFWMTKFLFQVCPPVIIKKAIISISLYHHLHRKCSVCLNDHTYPTLVAYLEDKLSFIDVTLVIIIYMDDISTKDILDFVNRSTDTNQNVYY